MESWAVLGLGRQYQVFLSKKIVGRHAGTILAKNNSDERGATFRIEVELTKEDAPKSKYLLRHSSAASAHSDLDEK